MSLLLALDVGNTQITIGAFRGKKLTQSWRLPTQPITTASTLRRKLAPLLRNKKLAGIIIASVVPRLDRPLSRACAHFLHRKPLFVNPKMDLGIVNRYKRPTEVGADRLVNAVAVDALLGGPAIVVDFGTATTFDCVSAQGDYLGGVIAPGLELAQEALISRAAKLFRVPFAIPRRVMGRTTKESLQSGLFFGYIALVEGMLQRLIKGMGGRPKIIATGGLSQVIGPRIRFKTRIMPALTLEGLRIIWERNHD